jgi:hypothetical protein
VRKKPYMVMVRCPTADTAVPTGIRCDVADFSHISITAPIACPACGGVHLWSLSDARLRDADFVAGDTIGSLHRTDEREGAAPS